MRPLPCHTSMATSGMQTALAAPTTHHKGEDNGEVRNTPMASLKDTLSVTYHYSDKSQFKAAHRCSRLIFRVIIAQVLVAVIGAHKRVIPAHMRGAKWA